MTETVIVNKPPEVDADDPGALTAVTYWLTRDRIRGRLVDRVDVWLVKPVYRRHGGDLYWLAPFELIDPSAARFDTWTLARARREVRNGLPDHEMQCVRNGPDYDSLEGLCDTLPDNHPLYPRADTEPGTREEAA